jgi:outer membrane immunogenic protein
VNRYLTLALSASAFVATPALAQDAAVAAGHDFTGPRVGVNVGFADDSIFGTEAFTYGADVGYDFAVGNAVLGVTAEIEDSKDISRELALTARAGARVGSNGLLYVTGGYSNIRAYGVNVDGFRLGVGGELGLGQNAYVKLEQRYGNYEYGLDLYQTMIGAGFRF